MANDVTDARPLPEGMVPFKPMTTPESRDALAKWMSLNAHDGSAYEGLMHLMVDRDLYETEVCRLSAELDRLRARLAEAEAEKAETRKILVRCHDRIHALARTSDTDLAIAIERLLGRLARGGSDER